MTDSLESLETFEDMVLAALDEVGHVLGDIAPGHDLERFANYVKWADKLRGGATVCLNCSGTGTVPAPYSGSIPSCPACSGEGALFP